MVTGIKLVNYKLHRDFETKPDGRSFRVIGDIEEGKTTLIELIEACLMLRPFDPNPLSEGAESGRAEISYDLGDGHIYTVRRRFTKKGLMRFEVTDENGGDHSLKPLLEKILGKAFMNSYFDYTKYFYQLANSNDRTDYFVKAAGADVVLENLKKIRVQTKERNQVGGEINTYETLIENSILDPDRLEEDTELYKEPKSLADVEKYEPLVALINQLTVMDVLNEAFDVVKQANDEFDVKTERNTTIDERIAEIERELKDLKAEKKTNIKWLNDNPADREYENELYTELVQAIGANELLMPEIEAARNEAIEDINNFNQRRVQFNQGVQFFEKYTELSERYEAITDNILELKETNKNILLEKLPLPELSVEDDVVMYEDKDGVKRELCFPNISKGRSIILAARIQRALNPKGNNLIVIPEGNLLGSGLDEVAQELESFGVQYIVEITEPKTKLTIKFEENTKKPAEK